MPNFKIQIPNKIQKKYLSLESKGILFGTPLTLFRLARDFYIWIGHVSCLRLDRGDKRKATNVSLDLLNAVGNSGSQLEVEQISPEIGSVSFFKFDFFARK